MKIPTRFDISTSMHFRYFLGLLCMLVAWLYPFSEGASTDAFQQIVAFGSLAAASLLFGVNTINVAVAASLVMFLIIIMTSANPYVGAQFAGVSGVFLAGLSSCVGAQLRHRPKGLVWFLFAIVAASFINALEGLLQWFGLVGALYPWVVEPDHRGLAFGAFRQTNLFATFLCVGSICTVWLVHLRRLSSAMAWFLLLILMFGVAASGSRTGVLEVIALALWALLWRKHHVQLVIRLYVGQLAILGLALAVLPVIAGWLEFDFQSSVVRAARAGHDARLLIWSNAIDMIYEHPWVGWGWHETGFGHYSTLFERRYVGLLDNVHNLPLQLAVEFGVPVAAFSIFVISYVIFRAKPWPIGDANKRNSDSVELGFPFAWAILILIIAIHSMLEYPLWYAGYLFLMGVSAGYLLPVTTHGTTLDDHKVWSLRLVKLCALLMIFVAVSAWQQYTKVVLIYKTPFTNNRNIQRAATAIALDNASGSWLFQEYLDFAILGWEVVTPENAFQVRKRAEKLVQFSANPRVIEPLLLSLWYLNDVGALKFHAERFCRAFPSEFHHWRQEHATHPMMLPIGGLSEKCHQMNLGIGQL